MSHPLTHTIDTCAEWFEERGNPMATPEDFHREELIAINPKANTRDRLSALAYVARHSQTKTYAQPKPEFKENYRVPPPPTDKLILAEQQRKNMLITRRVIQSMEPAPNLHMREIRDVNNRPAPKARFGPKPEPTELYPEPKPLISDEKILADKIAHIKWRIQEIDKNKAVLEAQLADLTK